MIATLLSDPVVAQSLTDGLGQFLRPETLFSVLVDGLAKSALFLMIATGLTLIFGLIGVLNFAHGSLTMLGAYIGGLIMILTVTQGTGNWARLGLFFIGILIVFGLMAGLGGAIEVGLIRPLYDRPPIYQILLTFGVTLVLDELARIIVLFYDIQPITDWQAALGTKPTWFTDPVNLGLASVRGLALFQVLFGVVTVAIVWAFLTKTRYGLIVRAGSQDSEMTEALGINVRRVFTVVFALGAGIAGVAGMLLMWDKNWGASVPLAAETLLPAFVVVIVGGLGTFRGTVYAALIVGLADAVTTWWFINVVDLTFLPEVVVFAILVLVLVVRPRGLFGIAEVGGH